MICYLFDNIKNAQVGSGSRDPKEILWIHKADLTREFYFLFFSWPRDSTKLLFTEFFKSCNFPNLVDSFIYLSWVRETGLL